MENPQVTHRKSVYSTKWFSVVEKKVRTYREPYYSLHLPDYISIIALTKAHEIILVKQYRPAVEKYVIELPAGTIEKNESPAAAAERELLEETGYGINGIEYIDYFYPDTGRLENKAWYCFVKDVEPVKVEFEKEFGIETIVCGLKEFKQMLLDGNFNHAIHVAMLNKMILSGYLNLD